MTEQMRNDLTPQGYIRHMFSETKNGEFKVEYTDFFNNSVPKERILQLNWTAEDAEKVEQRYSLLTSALARIARIHDQLADEESRKKLLFESDFDVWNTYVQPFEPLEVNWDELDSIPPCEPEELPSLIYEIHERAIGDLIPEEEKLLKWHYMWREEQSQKRIPFNRRSSADMITRAMRYEKLLSIGAPEIIVTEEGRYLAEEMVLYYFGKEETIVWD
ncbi:MAG: hypothetical protein IIX54_04955 [Clostridia bacterium]|nr:hypothetical protein [Clostridia bacterium]